MGLLLLGIWITLLGAMMAQQQARPQSIGLGAY